MDLNCCLCRTALPSEKRKRKRLHGLSCREVKERLENISSVPLDSLLETRDPNAYLCRNCENVMSSIGTFNWRQNLLCKNLQSKRSCLSYTERCECTAAATAQTIAISSSANEASYAYLNVLKQHTLCNRHQPTRIHPPQLYSHHQLPRDKLKNHHQMCR